MVVPSMVDFVDIRAEEDKDIALKKLVLVVDCTPPHRDELVDSTKSVSSNRGVANIRNHPCMIGQRSLSLT